MMIMVAGLAVLFLPPQPEKDISVATAATARKQRRIYPPARQGLSLEPTNGRNYADLFKTFSLEGAVSLRQARVATNGAAEGLGTRSR